MTVAAYIALVKKAEGLMASAGLTPAQRLSALRGIYYGTPWSVDTRVEHNWIRALLFTTFAGAVAPDPRTILGTRLFGQLSSAQDLRQGRIGVDIGHALIGIESQLNASRAGAAVAAPMGGTPVEVVTWLGDLGGGAANLTFARALGRAASVQSIFVNRAGDYGDSANLEGDVAGVVVGSVGGMAVMPGSATPIADLLSLYFPTSRTSLWTRRATLFASSASISGTTAATLTGVIDKIETFAIFYLVHRYVSAGKLTPAQTQAACQHLHGAATEIAITFGRALARVTRSGTLPIAGAAPWPAPSARGPCTSRVLRAVSTASGVGEELNELKRQFSKYLLEAL